MLSRSSQSHHTNCTRDTDVLIADILAGKRSERDVIGLYTACKKSIMDYSDEQVTKHPFMLEDGNVERLTSIWDDMTHSRHALLQKFQEDVEHTEHIKRKTAVASLAVNDAQREEEETNRRLAEARSSLHVSRSKLAENVAEIRKLQTGIRKTDLSRKELERRKNAATQRLASASVALDDAEREVDDISQKRLREIQAKQAHASAVHRDHRERSVKEVLAAKSSIDTADRLWASFVADCGGILSGDLTSPPSLQDQGSTIVPGKS